MCDRHGQHAVGAMTAPGHGEELACTRMNDLHRGNLAVVVGADTHPRATVSVAALLPQSFLFLWGNSKMP